jgi:beta-N-acetylhexosaminidase
VLYSQDLPSGSSSRNIASPSQLSALTGELKAERKAPVVIAVDQEGGSVARLTPAYGFPATVSAASLGAANDVNGTYAAAATMAKTLKNAGINLNFAPDVDLNVNPTNPVIGALGRSFSADPAIVTRNAEAFIRAHHDNGILCTLKHFPGHGSSTADSHLGFVDVSDTWSNIELQPFRNIVADGLADVIMTAHIFNSHLDPDYPATLSYATVTGILRQQLGYDGVVISDDMQMGAITQQFGFAFAIEKAVLAGVDILLCGNNLPDSYDDTLAVTMIDTIESLVVSGAIPESRIDESYRRIQALAVRLA